MKIHVIFLKSRAYAAIKTLLLLLASQHKTVCKAKTTNTDAFVEVLRLELGPHDWQ